MIKSRFNLARSVRAFLLLIFAASALHLIAPNDAEARAGGSRSFGRSSRPSAAPSQNYRNQPNPPPSNYGSQPQAQPQRGGMGRAIAGGLAGGFLGSMLFSSMGHAAGGMGGAGGGGGFGIIEIILVAGLAYLAFRWWKNRQQKLSFSQGAAGASGTDNAFRSGSAFGGNENFGASNQANGMAQNQAAAAYVPLNGSGLESEEASDIFFKVQAAWTRRDLSSVTGILGTEVYQTLMFDLSELKAKKQINRLENISVRKVDIGERWNEYGNEFARVRFTANLLDYTVDEQSGTIVSGSNTDPVKFEEDWTFSRTSAFGPWQLVGIGQV